MEMSQDELIELLKNDIQAFNQWREANPNQKIDLSGVDLRDTNLSHANLSDAYLEDTDLSRARLIKTNLHYAYLGKADLTESFLDDANLSYAALMEAKLRRATLKDANLSHANFSPSDLTGANLTRIKALGTNFTETTLTGACLQDWSINSSTKFDKVRCEYVYFKEYKKDRRPCDETKNFLDQEFSSLIQELLSNIDLIFLGKISQQSFQKALHKSKIRIADIPTNLQEISSDSEGKWIIKISVPPELNRSKIEEFIRKEYDHKLQISYDKIKNLKEELEHFRKIDIIKANQQPLVQNIAKLIVSMNNIDQSNSNIGVGINQGTTKGDIAGILNKSEQTNLADAAKEIQSLLQRLEQTNPTTSTTEQMVVATEIIKQIEENPDWKQRAISACQQGILEALKTHPIGALVVGGIAGWQKS